MFSPWPGPGWASIFQFTLGIGGIVRIVGIVRDLILKRRVYPIVHPIYLRALPAFMLAQLTVMETVFIYKGRVFIKAAFL